MTGKTAKEFPLPGPELQSKEGRERLKRGVAQHDTIVQQRKDAYDNFISNKRTIFE